MKLKSRKFLFVFVAFFLLGSDLTGTSARAETQKTKWEQVDVLLLDDTIYTKVTVAWILEGYTIEITKWDGERINVAPTLIEKIVDRDGVDITNEVADSSPASDMNFALLGDKRTKPFLFRFMLLGGLSAAVTNSDDSHKPIGAAFAGARLGLSEKFHLSGFYRRQHLIESASAAGGTFSTDANEFHLMLGLRTTHPRRNNNYGYMEAGIMIIDFEDRFDNATQSWKSDGSPESGLVIQGGVVIPIAESFAIDLNGLLEYRPSVVDSGGSVFLIGLNVAFAYFSLSD